MISRYLGTGLRHILRNKLYSFINIAGLSLGLSSAILIILYIKDELSFDRFQKNVSNIYRVNRRMTGPNGDISLSGSTGLFQGPRFKAEVPEIQNFVRYKQGYRDIKSGTDVQAQEVHYADTSFFTIFSFPFLYGDSKTALDQPNSIVITEEIAKKQFGMINAVGKIILIKNKDQFEPYKVTAIAKKCPQNSSIRFQYLLPFITSGEDEQKNENWFNSYLSTFVVLHSASNSTAVETKINKVFESDAAEAIAMIKTKYGIRDIGLTHFLQPLTDIHLNPSIHNDSGISASDPLNSYILSGIAVFILLNACVNFINLTVVCSLKRVKEIGIRKVMGSSRRRLIMKFVGESFILCLISLLLAIVIAMSVLPMFNTLSQKSLSLSYLLDTNLAMAYMGLFLFTGLLAGFYPALVLSGFSPAKIFYNRISLVGKNYLQKSLIVTQFALGSFLIIATFTIFSQFSFLTNNELGYDESNLVSVEINGWGMKRGEAELAKQQLMKDPNILGVSSKNSGSWNTAAKVNGETSIQFAYETVDEYYVPLLKIPIKSGRNFSQSLSSDVTRSVLVNETFVKEAGWKNLLGQMVDFYNNGEKYRVIGVLKDHHYESLAKKIGPQLFTMNPENPFGKTFIKIRAGSEIASINTIEKVFKSLFPMNSYVYTLKSQENQNSYEAEARWKQIMLFSASLTIFISCIGLFGLSVLAAEKRAREISIRKVLGASICNVAAMLSKEFLLLVFLSLLLAIPIGWLAANKWLQSYPYRINLNGWIFTKSAMLVFLVALLTVGLQAIKAATVNPIRNLRRE